MDLLKAMKSRIQAINAQHRRDEVRTKIGQYLLLILLILFVVEEVKEIFKPHTILIENAQTQVETVEVKEIEEVKELSIEDKIRKEFGADGEIALAVFKAESRLDATAINYNCEGYQNGICPKGLEHKAWSVDCGIAQINTLGKTCPKELFDPEVNIKKAKEMHAKRGFKPWYAFKDGVYKKYLTN